jgi:hypothetical protein
MSSRPSIAAPAMPPGASAPWNSPKYSFKTQFNYETDISAALAPAGSTTLTFNIAGDSDFFWTKFEAFALVGGVATVRNADELPAVTVLIVNTTSGRQYSSLPTPLPNVSGTGQLPFILPQITLWESKSTVSVQLANIGNATYSNLMLTFSGIKAFLA